MFRWLSGLGAVFKDPLPGSTNYLSAYDASGRLWRLGQRKPESRDDGKKGEESAEGEETARKEGEQNLAMGEPIPVETSDDFSPFPTNHYFRSEPVLSEELREEIWNRVVNQGKSVRAVSADLGVEMNRVGAVVRLKTVEKEWIKKVCLQYNG